MRTFVLLCSFVAPLLAVVEAKAEKIRGVRDPIYHLYLQSHPDNSTIPVLGPEGYAEAFDVAATIKSTNTSLFLNVGQASTSYKALSFGSSATMNAWGLEGDTIVTTRGSSYGRQLNFLACQIDPEYWQLYLQTGSDAPTDQPCSNYQTIHLPCLC
ncbi:hypothetical protein ACHAQH_001320 [Verticillium albo-atrum]